MWLKKIKSKKQQFLLVFIIMLLTTIIFSVCFGFIVAVNQYINDYYGDEKNGDYFVNTSNEQVKDTIEDWAENNDAIEAASTVTGMYIASTIQVKDEKFDPNFLYAFPINDVDDLGWRMDFVEDSRKTAKPGDGEIWISSVFADLHDVALGDKISILGVEKKEYEVSAILNNAVCPSATLGIDYVYLNQKELDSLEGFPTQYFVAVKNASDADYTVNYYDLVNEVGSGVGGVIFSKSLLIQVATMISNIIGGIGLFAAVIILIGTNLIIRFILKSILQKEYKSIGIYKALGFGNFEIRMIYIKCFSIVIACTTVLGSVLGNIIADKVAGTVLCFVGNYQGVATAYIISSAVTIVVLNAIVIVNLFLVTGSINKMSPVNAIRASVEVNNASPKRKTIKNASNIFTNSINDILKNRKSSFLMLIILTMSFFLLILFVNINYSIQEIKNNSNIWFGTPKCNATISGDLYGESNENQISDELNNNIKVENYSYGEMTSTASVILDSQKYNLSNTNIGITIFNTYNDNGFIVSDGKNPEEIDEVAVSKTIMDEAELNIGDKIILSINGEDKEFTICGTYVTQLNLGYNLRILIDALGDYKDNYRESEIYVKLKDTEDFDDLKKEIEDKYYGVSVEKIIPATKDTIYTIEQIVNPVIGILVIAFIVFALINIINLIIMYNLDNRKSYGIMKAFGFSTLYICMRNLIKILLISLVSVCFAFVLNALVSAHAFAIAVGGIDGLLFNIVDSCSIILATLLMMICTVGICCISIRGISTKELMEE